MSSWICIYSVHAHKGRGGFAYRAWTSVVFLLLTGIAKPLSSVKTNWTPRFSMYICKPQYKLPVHRSNSITMKKLFLLSIASLMAIVVFSQDIIVTRDSKRIESKIEEVSAENVKYRKISNLDGPLFVLSTSEIQLIVYQNGEVQMFNQVQEQPTMPKEYEIVPEMTASVPSPDVEEPIKEKRLSDFVCYLEASGIVGKESTKAATGSSVTLNPVLGGFDVHAIFGSKIGNLLFFGGGVGINSAFAGMNLYGGSMSVSTCRMPVYIDTRVFIPVRSEIFRPTAEIAAGPIFSFVTHVTAVNAYGDKTSYNTNDELPLSTFFRVGIGGEVKRFVFGVGYELWGNKTDCDHFAYFKLGVRLGRL